jgi:hypothetical protein
MLMLGSALLQKEKAALAAEVTLTPTFMHIADTKKDTHTHTLTLLFAHAHMHTNIHNQVWLPLLH